MRLCVLRNACRESRYLIEVRLSNRTITATLLPLVLFNDNFKGLRLFVQMVEEKAGTERYKDDKRHSKKAVHYHFSDVELITEFHIKRDVEDALRRGSLISTGEALLPPEEEAAAHERRDAPDLVIVAGRELIVCEAKFFGRFSGTALNQQLKSQRRQVKYLFQARPELRAYRQVAIVPQTFDGNECDAVLTWEEIGDLSASVLGDKHYVTRRLKDAVARYKRKTGRPGVPVNDGVLSLDKMLAKCREWGNEVSVGNVGGENALRSRDHAYAGRKRWKWRNPQANRGAANMSNWIGGKSFVRIIESMAGASTARGKTPKR
jgi:hypothetical protein